MDTYRQLSPASKLWMGRGNELSVFYAESVMYAESWVHFYAVAYYQGREQLPRIKGTDDTGYRRWTSPRCLLHPKGGTSGFVFFRLAY